jgi:hypothetical protein
VSFILHSLVLGVDDIGPAENGQMLFCSTQRKYSATCWVEITDRGISSAKGQEFQESNKRDGNSTFPPFPPAIVTASELWQDLQGIDWASTGLALVHLQWWGRGYPCRRLTLPVWQSGSKLSQVPTSANGLNSWPSSASQMASPRRWAAEPYLLVYH